MDVENKKSPIEDIFLKTWHPYVWIASLGFLLYFQAILFDFTYFDDDKLILGNSYNFLRNPSNIFEAFKQNVFGPKTGIYYRPLLTISFMLDAQISGQAPWMYHLSNIIIHIIASFLLFTFLRRLKYSKKLALFFSLIFTVHPALTHAVCWIPGRNDSLAAVFILASFIFLFSFIPYGIPSNRIPSGIEKKKWRYYGLHILFLALALFTKELGLVIIAMALVYLLIIAKEKILSLNMMLLVFGWVTVITCWLLARYAVFNYFHRITISDIFNAIWKELPITFIFLGKILFPVNLSTLPILKGSTFIFGYITLILLVIALVVTRKIRVNFVIFGALWFILFLSPTFVASQIFKVPYLMEPRIYLPLIGFIIILLETGLIKNQALARTGHPVGARKGWAIGAIVVIGLSILSFSYSKVFKDGLRYWENAIANSPPSPFVCNNLGVSFYREGIQLLDIDEQEYQRMLRDNPAAQRNLNSEYYPEAMRLINKAETKFREALELNPADKAAHNNIGMIYKLKKMYQEAEEEFRKALEIDPTFNRPFYNLGMLYADRYLIKKAEAELLAEKGNSAESDPLGHHAGDPQGHPVGDPQGHHAGEKKLKKADELLMEMKKLGCRSIDEYKKIIKAKPNYADIYRLGLAYGMFQIHQDAIESYKQIIKVKPDYAEAYYDLGNTYEKSGMYQEAIESYKQAIKVKPDYAEAYYRITVAYLQIDNKSDAITYYEILKKLDAELAKKIYVIINSK